VKNTDEDKLRWLTFNVFINSIYIDNFDYRKEALIWASGKDYFPKLNEDEFLAMARNYEIWNSFEEAFLNKENNI
jgi:hypothetical protein